jgi:dTDP-3,4-didehydro-2,6-dideoxy-alpha-D-glucose 3-reductase
MKIGILNCSDIARRRMIPAIKRLGFEIPVICSRDIKKAKDFAKEFEIHRYTDDPADLKNIDAVYISSPPSEHAESIEFFLNRGINVLCEKSITTSLEDTERLIKLAESKGLIVMENYAFQFHPQWKWILTKIERCELGTILSINADFKFPKRPDPNDFRYNTKLGGGALLDCGGYPLMVVNLLSKGGLIHTQFNQIYRDDLDIHGSAMICDKNTTFHLSWGMESFYRCSLEIIGTEGMIFTPKIFTPKSDEEVLLQYYRHEWHLPEIYHFQSDQFAEILHEFERCIKEKDSSHHRIIESQSYLQENAKITSIRTFID